MATDAAMIRQKRVGAIGAHGEKLEKEFGRFIDTT